MVLLHRKLSRVFLQTSGGQQWNEKDAAEEISVWSFLRVRRFLGCKLRLIRLDKQEELEIK